MDARGLVKALGVPAHWDGCLQLEYACSVVLADEKLLVNVGKLVFVPIAEKFGISAKCVESNIHRAISFAWQSGTRRMLQEIMVAGLDKAPGNVQFIAAACRYLRDCRMSS